ncbi:hypothetical protein ACE38V_12810 [Cytobacillus sp. Hz8]
MTTYVNHRSKEYLEQREAELKEKTGLTRSQHIKNQRKKELLKKLKKI